LQSLPLPCGDFGRRLGVECKRADAPRLTPSMKIAFDDLKLDRLVVAYPGDHRYRLTSHVEVIPLTELTAMRPSSLFSKSRR
jgi:hypothetical protein